MPELLRLLIQASAYSPGFLIQHRGPDGHQCVILKYTVCEAYDTTAMLGTRTHHIWVITMALQWSSLGDAFGLLVKGFLEGCRPTSRPRAPDKRKPRPTDAG